MKAKKGSETIEESKKYTEDEGTEAKLFSS
jgi:hypothetical protein